MRQKQHSKGGALGRRRHPSPASQKPAEANFALRAANTFLVLSNFVLKLMLLPMNHERYDSCIKKAHAFHQRQKGRIKSRCHRNTYRSEAYLRPYNEPTQCRHERRGESVVLTGEVISRQVEGPQTQQVPERLGYQTYSIVVRANEGAAKPRAALLMLLC